LVDYIKLRLFYNARGLSTVVLTITTNKNCLNN